MTETAEKLAEAEQRLKDKAEPVKRTKRPAQFHVFVQNEPGAWGFLTEAGPIVAVNRKEAIREATMDMRAEDKVGRFWAVPADQFQPVTRTTRQETIDDWE